MADSHLDPDIDRAFHHTLYVRLDNPLVGQLVELFWEAYHAARATLDLARPTGAEAAHVLDCHRAIVTALRSGDRAAARRAMTAHFAEIKHRLGPDLTVD